jgi:hypothetical protein
LEYVLVKFSILSMIIGSSPQPSPKERELGIRIGEILNPFDDYWVLTPALSKGEGAWNTYW